MTATFTHTMSPPVPCDPDDVVIGDLLLTSAGLLALRFRKAPYLWVLADGRRVRPVPGVPVLIQRLVHIPQAA